MPDDIELTANRKKETLRVACFTGHRDIPDNEITQVPALLEWVIRKLYERGVREFRTGGAWGFDTAAAIQVLHMKQVYADIRLTLILPCADQTGRWKPQMKTVYERIKGAADEVRVLYERYTPWCMRERDRELVNGSDVCVAYCARSSGGTAYTVSYAMEHGVRVINLYERIKGGKRDE